MGFVTIRAAAHTGTVDVHIIGSFAVNGTALNAAGLASAITLTASGVSEIASKATYIARGDYVVIDG